MRGGIGPWPVCLALVWIVGCAGVDVTRDFDPDYDFSGLHTFHFLDTTPDRTGVDETTLARIHHAIETELTLKGYEKSTAPDVGVAVHGGRQTQMDIDAAVAKMLSPFLPGR